MSATLDLQVRSLCKTLKLPSVGRDAARLASEATRQKLRHLPYLHQLLETEVAERAERRTSRRIREAGFPVLKTLDSFDFGKAPHLPEALIRELAEGGYIDQAQPVIFYGEPGTGKTHLATALGVAASQQGRRVRFVTAAYLVNHLTESRESRELNRAIGRYARIDLLIVDELGYVPLSKIDAELLFQVLGERQERRPIVVTTNLPFSEWTSVFPDARLCRAVIDRLTHNAHIIETGEKSIRLDETLRKKGKVKK